MAKISPFQCHFRSAATKIQSFPFSRTSPTEREPRNKEIRPDLASIIQRIKQQPWATSFHPVRDRKGSKAEFRRDLGRLIESTAGLLACGLVARVFLTSTDSIDRLSFDWMPRWVLPPPPPLPSSGRPDIRSKDRFAIRFLLFVRFGNSQEANDHGNDVVVPDVYGWESLNNGVANASVSAIVDVNVAGIIIGSRLSDRQPIDNNCQITTRKRSKVK